jgi:membrane protein
MLPVREWWNLSKKAVYAWVDDSAASMGAALAYYTTFSLAPMLVIAIAIAGFVFGPKAARGELVHQLSGVIGTDGARVIEGLLQNASHPGSNAAASIIGLVTLLLGATSVFVELQSSLDRIWRAPALKEPGAVKGLLKSRLLSFGMVIALGFLLLVSLVLDSVLSAISNWGGSYLPGGLPLLRFVNLVAAFGVTTLMFAITYRVLPRARIAWSDVWIGAIVTSLLFTLGKHLIGLYLGYAGVSSSFGAAGSLVVILLWVYYSAQIFLLGAEFTWVYAHSRGSHAGTSPPSRRAVDRAA